MKTTFSPDPAHTSLPATLPELLAPAGSPDALEAALNAGADAVYLGGSAFNARMMAHNFGDGELRDAVALAHGVGGRIYLTLNTLIYDREMADALRAAYDAAARGVDGLIIADPGAAALIHGAIPSLPLHASTQLSGHNAAVGRMLAPFGFSRFVIARETSLGDLETAVRQNPLEVEVFIHGALCVCHSGQCLFSSLVGGRSGNRGECAQPCRLPYRNGDPTVRGAQKGPEEYPLSLKDLSLAGHVPELLRAGVASLKIEGRMKSAAYVGGVVSVWRRLLDERRAATGDEMRYLADLFSRGGFTDGYLTGKIDHAMMGVRSESDKARSADAAKAPVSGRGAYLPLSMAATVRAGAPLSLTVSAPAFRQGETTPIRVTVTDEGPSPEPARNPAAALTPEALSRQLGKLGGTAYRLAAPIDVRDAEPGLILPLSRLNALRRDALEALDKARLAAIDGRWEVPSVAPSAPAAPRTSPTTEEPSLPAPRRTACFRHPTQITKAAEAYFDLCYLPLFDWVPAAPGGAKPRGVSLPPVIFDHEAARVKERLTDVLAAGAGDVLVGNLGHLPLVREAMEAAGVNGRIRVHGDFRLNVTNRHTVSRLCDMAEAAGTPLTDLLLSPELTLPRLRDLHRSFPARVGSIVYGRLPLMVLEKCVIRELYPRSADPRLPCGAAGAACAACASDQAVLCDRRGVRFPVLREFDHRNLILNSLPLSMTDRPADLSGAGILHRHYLFTVESPSEVNDVIRAAKDGRPVGGEVRRIR